MPGMHGNKLRVTYVFALLDFGRMLLSYCPCNKINQEAKQLSSDEDNRQCQKITNQVIHRSIISIPDVLICNFNPAEIMRFNFESINCQAAHAFSQDD